MSHVPLRHETALSPRSLACDSGRWSLPPSTAPDRLPTRGTHPHARQETDAHRRSRIHERDVADIDGVPAAHVPIHLPPHGIDAVEMATVRDEQADEQGPPDLRIGRRAQDEGFVEGETQVQVRQLRENDLGGDGYAGLGA